LTPKEMNFGTVWQYQPVKQEFVVKKRRNAAVDG